jgi:hypothetical protein
MARFTIQTRIAIRAKADQALQIAPIGFCWAAFFLGPLWLINRGAWAAAIADAGFLVLIDLLVDMIRPGLWPLLVSLLVAERLFIGFEGFDALRANWTSKGFVQMHLASGHDEEETLARWLVGQRPIPASQSGGQSGPQPTLKSPVPKAPNASNSLFPLSGLMGKLAQSKSFFGLKP